MEEVLPLLIELLPLLIDLKPLLVLLLHPLPSPWLLLSCITDFSLGFLLADDEGREVGNGFAPLPLMQLGTDGFLGTEEGNGDVVLL